VIKGARANGGMTAPGTYLVGERGPELATFSQPANVTSTRALKGFANDNQSGAIHVTFGTITSNDPAAVKAMALQAMAEAAPIFRKQAVDATLAKLKRPGL